MIPVVDAGGEGMAMSENYHCRYDSSIGELLLTSDGRSVTGLYMSPFAMEGKGDQNPSACMQSQALRVL